ncbi:MAG: hypothetical protein HKP45_03635, partial [Winogradskyella sp.]|nr:hypothetical protein [Winogradskyella sp.]
YEVTLYKDGEDAHWNDNPLDLEIEKFKIQKNDELMIRMAEGGGFAMSLIKN